MRTRLTPLPALCLSLLAALSLGACNRDAAPKATSVKADAAGQVRVTEGPALERWIPPTVNIAADQVDAALEQAETAARNKQWFRDDQSVLPIVLAVESIATNTPKQQQRAESLRKDAIDALLQQAITRVGVVRFRAFQDMGSDLSYAVALLDSHNNGVVLSSIFGREDSRSYVKPIEEGHSTYTLTQEEEQALQKAMQGHS